MLLGLAAVSAGCQSGKYKDPHDPPDRVVAPEALSDNLQSISDALLERRVKGEITHEEYKELIAKAASELVKQLDLRRVEPSKAWRYGEVLRAGRNWAAAKEMLIIAVKHDRASGNEDRRVNDTLRLAHVQTKLGEIPEAIVTANEVMSAKPSDSAPILMAVLYEIVPAARGKGHDPELVVLLRAAIQKHLRTTVDPSTEAGKQFLAARVHHVPGAYAMLSSLLSASGKTVEAEKALETARLAQSDFESFTTAELAKEPRVDSSTRLSVNPPR